MIKFDNTGYFETKIHFKKPEKGVVKLFKYLVKFTHLNILSPLNNFYLHPIKSWKIIDCNLKLKKGIAYNIYSENHVKDFFLKMLFSPHRGKISGLEKYNVILNSKISANKFLYENCLILENEAVKFNEYKLEKNIILVFSSQKIKSKNIKIEYYNFLHNRFIKC